MEVTNAVYPPKAQFDEFFAAGEDGPFVMVNLLKFRDRAVYDDDPTIDISGEEAYEIYGAEVTKLVEAAGGRVVFTGDVTGIILGEAEDLWDVVALAGQLNIRTVSR